MIAFNNAFFNALKRILYNKWYLFTSKYKVNYKLNIFLEADCIIYYYYYYYYYYIIKG